MAETADILTTDQSESIFTRYACGLFDGRHGGYSPDRKSMGNIKECLVIRFLPLTYVNSTAAIKAFVGEHGGATVTSSNAEKMVAVGI